MVYRIIDPTVEEVLQRLNDNYAKIYDFSADMLINVNLNNQPLDKPQYCRYYFKAPQNIGENKTAAKEKTETFIDAARTVKTSIIIINGKDMSSINLATLSHVWQLVVARC